MNLQVNMAQADIYYGHTLLLPLITNMDQPHYIGRLGEDINSRISNKMYFYLEASISKDPAGGNQAVYNNFDLSSSDPVKEDVNTFPVFKQVHSEGVNIEDKLVNLDSFFARVEIGLDSTSGNGNEELYVGGNLVSTTTVLEIPITSNGDISQSVKCYINNIDGTQTTEVRLKCYKLEFLFRRTERRLLESGEVEEEVLDTVNTEHDLVKIRVK